MKRCEKVNRIKKKMEKYKNAHLKNPLKHCEQKFCHDNSQNAWHGNGYNNIDIFGHG